jgi:hypothetical protein
LGVLVPAGAKQGRCDPFGANVRFGEIALTHVAGDGD